MKESKEHYVFHKYKNFKDCPDVFVSDNHNYEDAIFEFVFQTLGYAILKVKSNSDIEVTEV